MAYVSEADFRTASVTEYAKDLILDTTEAPAALVTSAITRISEAIDTATGDHFEATAAATIDVSVPGDSDDSVWGVGGRQGPSRLYLPKRTRALTSVKTRDLDGTLTAEASTVYRLHSSLNAAGTDFADDGDAYDWIEVIPGKDLSTGERVWPPGPNTVQTVGNFDWAGIPADIKRAVALLVYDHFKAETDTLRRADEWNTGTTFFQRATTKPFGIPEVDRIVETYTRPDPSAF